MKLIILQIILILLNAIFACAEIAVITINDTKLEKMAQDGDKRAKRLMKLTASPAQFLATIQVAITLSGFLGSAFAADNFSDQLVSLFMNIGIDLPFKTLDTIAVIIITLVLSFLTILFGELVPKRVAMKYSFSLALAMSSLITIISKVFAPLVWCLTVSTNFILRLIGIDPNESDEVVSEEEIRMLVDVGNQKGVINREEKEMIQNVFEFNDVLVSEFAIHRTQIEWLDIEDSLEKWDEIINQTKHSYYPICNSEIDSVVGVLVVKEYYAIKERTLDLVLNKAMNKVHFIPKSITANILFQQMKNMNFHFAVVLDEYGGVDGIVTINNVLEQIVGDLDTEDDGEKGYIEFVEENNWQVFGNVLIEDINKMLNINISDEFNDTFSGFVFSYFGSIPNDGIQFEIEYNCFKIKVLKIENHRITSAKISKDNILK